MEDKQLLKVAIITSIIGLIALFAIMRLTKIEESTIQSVKLCAKTDAAIEGTVSSLRTVGSMTIITVSEETSIQVITNQVPNLEVGEKIMVSGKVSQYKNENEIIAERIEMI